MAFQFNQKRGLVWLEACLSNPSLFAWLGWREMEQKGEAAVSEPYGLNDFAMMMVE